MNAGCAGCTLLFLGSRWTRAGAFWVEVDAAALSASGVSLVGAGSIFEIKALRFELSDTPVTVEEEGGATAFSAGFRKQSAAAIVPTGGE